MKDDKNLELRRKVLTKEFTANDLCVKEERELFNPEKRKETIEISKLNFDLDKKPEIVHREPTIEDETELNDNNKK